MSKESYAHYLERFHGGLSACWPQLDWALLERLRLPELQARQARYHSLSSDLDALGRPVTKLGSEPGSGQAAVTIGHLYVLEGSIHGGAILLAELQQKAGPISAEACGFFRGFGEQNRSYWKALMAWLETLDADDEFRETAATSAVKAFEHFIAAFNAPSATPTASR